MDLFEFILIITSVIYALAVAQVLSGVGQLAKKGTIRWFLPHTLWTVILFIFILLMWWAGWEFRLVEWTFPKFAYIVIAPTLIFFASSLVIPAPEESEVDLERHFFEIRRPFLWSIFFATLAVIGDGPILVGEPLWFPGRVAQVAFLCAVLGGVFTEDRRLHTSFSVAVLLVLMYISLTRFLMPG